MEKRYRVIPADGLHEKDREWIRVALATLDPHAPVSLAEQTKKHGLTIRTLPTPQCNVVLVYWRSVEVGMLFRRASITTSMPFEAECSVNLHTHDWIAVDLMRPLPDDDAILVRLSDRVRQLEAELRTARKLVEYAVEGNSDEHDDGGD